MNQREGNRLTDMVWDEVSLVDVPANQLADVLIWKSADKERTVPELADGAIDALPAEVQEYIGELEKMVAAQEDKLSKMADEMKAKMKGKGYDDEEEEGEDKMSKVLKGADPALVELVKGLQDRAEAAEMLAKSERETRLEGEFIAKAKAEFGGLPVDTEELGKALMHLAENVAPEQASVITTALSKASVALGNPAVFEEIGKTGDGEPPATATDGLEKVYSRVKTEPGYEGLSREQAITKALTENPELVAQLTNEGA